MMRPTIVQIIQYVRDGETDKQVAQLIEHDPRGEKKLSQARFICKMIGRQEPRPDVDISFAEDFSEPLIAESRAPSIERNVEEASYAQRSMSVDEPWSIEPRVDEARRLVRNSVEGPNRLGTLVATESGDSIELSFKPSEERRREKADIASPAAMADGDDSDRVTIEGTDYTLTLQRRQPRDMPATLEFQGSSAVPNLEILFMPDSGPFSRARPNREGIVTMTHLQEPGLLRIAGHAIDVLRIESKNIGQNS